MSERFYRGSFISAADNHFPSVYIDFSTASLHVVITPAFQQVVSGGWRFLLAETSSISAVHLYFSHHLTIIHPAKVIFYVVPFNHSAFCILHNLLGLLGGWCVEWSGVVWRGGADCLFFTLFRECFSVHTPARLSDGNAFTAFYSWAFKGCEIPGLR